MSERKTNEAYVNNFTNGLPYTCSNVLGNVQFHYHTAYTNCCAWLSSAFTHACTQCHTSNWLRSMVYDCNVSRLKRRNTQLDRMPRNSAYLFPPFRASEEAAPDRARFHRPDSFFLVDPMLRWLAVLEWRPMWSWDASLARRIPSATHPPSHCMSQHRYTISSLSVIGLPV